MTDYLRLMTNYWFYYRQENQPALEIEDSKDGYERRLILSFQAILDNLSLDIQKIKMKIPQVRKERYKERSFILLPTISKLMTSTRMKNKTSRLHIYLSRKLVFKT